MAHDELHISGFGSEEIGSRDRRPRREKASRAVDSTRPARDVFVSFAVRRLLRSDPTQKTLRRASTELSNGVSLFRFNWRIDRVIRDWRRRIARIQRRDRPRRPLSSWICGQTPAPMRTDPKDVWWPVQRAIQRYKNEWNSIKNNKDMNFQKKAPPISNFDGLNSIKLKWIKRRRLVSKRITNIPFRDWSYDLGQTVNDAHLTVSPENWKRNSTAATRWPPVVN
jgi:hypothetical protein